MECQRSVWGTWGSQAQNSYCFGGHWPSSGHYESSSLPRQPQGPFPSPPGQTTRLKMATVQIGTSADVNSSQSMPSCLPTQVAAWINSSADANNSYTTGADYVIWLGHVSISKLPYLVVSGRRAPPQEIFWLHGWDRDYINIICWSWIREEISRSHSIHWQTLN